MAELIRDEVFGLLQWDNIMNCWLGGIDWPPGLHTEVAIWQAGDDVATGLRMAHEGFAWIKANEEHARRCVTTARLGVYNDAWRDEDKPISVADFIQRIELVRIAFLDYGSLVLSYDGQAMFGGHVSDADFSADRTFRGASLVG